MARWTIFFLLLAVLLVANPLYLTPSPDTGNVSLEVTKATAGHDIADSSEEIAQQEELQPTARYAVSHALENGTYSVDRTARPLAMQAFERSWRYVAFVDQVALYRASVTQTDDATTLRLTNVSLQRVETALGVSPPGRLAETDSRREISWLHEQSETIVIADEFTESWESRLHNASSTGDSRVPDGNDNETFAPLDQEVFSVLDGEQYYRSNVTSSNSTDANVVTMAQLDAEQRAFVENATAEVSGGSPILHSETLEHTQTIPLRDNLVRYDGEYYSFRRIYGTGNNLVVQMFRPVLFVSGVVSLLIAGFIEGTR
jgi:hypothetical protein